MDEALESRLDSLGLNRFGKQILELGVKDDDDLAHLEEQDLIDIGMTLVEARKLLRFAGATGTESLSAVRMGGVGGFDGGESTSIVQMFGHMTGDAPQVSRGSSGHKRRESLWWQNQYKRPKRLIFVRHGESEANVNRKITETVADHMLHLTAKGRQQALNAGVRLRELLGDETVKFTVSPYVRTRETLNGILRAWGKKDMRVREDVRIREQEYGNYDSPQIKEFHKEKKEFGAFYYRFPNGESPADCYDRASLFFETLYRSWADNEHQNHVIVSHGMMILVTLMRLAKMDIDQFENFESLKNCELVVLDRPDDDPKYHVAFTWAEGEEKHHGGLRMKDKAQRKECPTVCNGDPAAPLLAHASD